MRLTLCALLLLTSCPKPPIETPMKVTPVAVITPGDQEVPTGTVVPLDGSSSYHAEARPLTYAWRLRSKPQGSNAFTSSGIASSISVTPDVPGAFVVELVVTADGVASNPAVTVITASGPNIQLVANAGPDQRSSVTRTVMLDGRMSSAPMGGTLAYSWSLSSRPASSTAALQDGSTAQPRFTADVEGTYDVGLTVSANGQSASDTVRVTVAPFNNPPVARVGPPQRVLPGNVVQLDGSASTDADGHPLTFRWTVKSQPAGSSVTLSMTDTAMTSFTATVAGAYAVELQVSDPEPLSSTASAMVNATTTVEAGDTFDPAEVYIAGTLSEGACYLDAMAHWSTPNVPAAGFDCYFDNRTAVLRPSDGRMLYTNTFEDKLRSFTCDSCPHPVGTGYPSMVLANDPFVPTPCPGGAMDLLGEFRVSPQGSVLHTCMASGKRWRNSAGTEVYDATSDDLVSYGHNDLVLTRTRVVTLGTMAASPIAGLPSRSWLTVRTLADGFWVALPGAAMTDPPELWKVAVTGAASKVGDYPPLPANIQSRFSARLDGVGKLFEMASDNTVSFRDVIARRAVGSTSDVVYTEATNPRVKLHISDLVTGP